jgi:hypothetical protein
MKKPAKRKGYAQGGTVQDDSGWVQTPSRPTPADIEAMTRAFKQGKTTVDLGDGLIMRNIDVGKARGGKVRKVLKGKR